MNHSKTSGEAIISEKIRKEKSEIAKKDRIYELFLTREASRNLFHSCDAEIREEFSKGRLRDKEWISRLEEHFKSELEIPIEAEATIGSRAAKRTILLESPRIQEKKEEKKEGGISKSKKLREKEKLRQKKKLERELQMKMIEEGTKIAIEAESVEGPNRKRRKTEIEKTEEEEEKREEKEAGEIFEKN